MIEEDIKTLKRTVLLGKAGFLLYFCALCAVLLAPVILLMLFAFSLPGRIALLGSLALFALACARCWHTRWPISTRGMPL